jgi:hypothetical protein
VSKTIYMPLLAAACWLGQVVGAAAAPPAQDPDWPCPQRLVPELSAGTFWDGPPPATVLDWHADPRVVKLVEAVAPRDVEVKAGTARIDAFAKALKASERPRFLFAALTGILDETNRQRTEIIERIKELARRQRGIADQVTKISNEVSAIPAEATGDDAQRRAEAVERQNFLTRTFDETRRTMRYACETPTELEARLGTYAKALEKLR